MKRNRIIRRVYITIFLVILIKMLPFSTDRETDFILVNITLRNVHIVELSNSNAVYSMSSRLRMVALLYGRIDSRIQPYYVMSVKRFKQYHF